MTEKRMEYEAPVTTTMAIMVESVLCESGSGRENWNDETNYWED